LMRLGNVLLAVSDRTARFIFIFADLNRPEVTVRTDRGECRAPSGVANLLLI
jgi:hypothetical protein